MKPVAALVTALGLFLVAAEAGAVGPVNPTTVEATAPTTNTDGSPLTDLRAIGFCVASSPTAPALACVESQSPTPSPTGNVVISAPFAAFPQVPDGQYYVEADAVDLSGNRSAKTARLPFEWNRVPPSAPGTPVIR